MQTDIDKSFKAIIEFSKKVDLEESIEMDLHQILQWTDNFNKYQINKEPVDGLLNIFVFNSNKFPEYPTFSELQIFKYNCVSFIDFDSIVIDIGFVYWYIENHNKRYFNLYSNDRQSDFKSNIKKSNWKESSERLMFFWVFGHELGHSFHRHNNSSFCKLDFQRLYIESSAHQIEIEADLFFVELVSKEPQLHTQLINFFTNMLNEEIALKIGLDTPPGVLIHFDYMGKNPVEYSKYGSHPEFVVRITKILYELAKLSGSQQHMRMIESFSATLKEL